MKLPKFMKKGQVFQGVSSVMIGLATVVIVAVVTFLIASQARTEIGSIEGVDCSVLNATEAYSSFACNATATAQEGMDTAVNFLPLIAIAAIGAVLIGLVALFRRGR